MPLLKALPEVTTKIPFTEKVNLTRLNTEILQINVGKYCNLACLHCHVEAGPKRTEKMTMATAKKIIELLDKSVGIHTLDLTGGAPELHEVFPYFCRTSFQARLNSN